MDAVGIEAAPFRDNPQTIEHRSEPRAKFGVLFAEVTGAPAQKELTSAWSTSDQ